MGLNCKMCNQNWAESLRQDKKGIVSTKTKLILQDRSSMSDLSGQIQEEFEI